MVSYILCTYHRLSRVLTLGHPRNMYTHGFGRGFVEFGVPISLRVGALYMFGNERKKPRGYTGEICPEPVSGIPVATLPPIFGLYWRFITATSLFWTFLWSLRTDCLWQHKIWGIIKCFTKLFEVKFWKTSWSVVALACSFEKRETSKLPYHTARFCLSLLSFRINVAIFCHWPTMGVDLSKYLIQRVYSTINCTESVGVDLSKYLIQRVYSTINCTQSVGFPRREFDTLNIPQKASALYN